MTNQASHQRPVHFPTSGERGPIPFPTSASMQQQDRQEPGESGELSAEDLRLMADTMPGEGPGD